MTFTDKAWANLNFIDGFVVNGYNVNIGDASCSGIGPITISPAMSGTNNDYGHANANDPSNVVEFGYCFYLGNFGQNFTTVCTNHSSSYFSATTNYSGSNGTNSQYQAALVALGQTITGFSTPADDLGCSIDGTGASYRAL
ncbi:MAG TPA: hypothetical protein VHO68_03420 [Bacteroidales bacterium]|nr:hypothetical protein [Bacteroidales bacterium]